MKNVPTRHHYISQFFLKNFSPNRSTLWVFDRVKKEIRYQDIKKIASQNKLYSYKKKGGEEKNLEDLLCKVEDLSKPIIDKLISKSEITMQEKADLSLFLALLKVRVPSFKKWTEKSGERFYKDYNQIVFSNRDYVEAQLKRSGNTLTKKEVDDLIVFATDKNRYSVKFPSNYWLGTMLKLSSDLADIFIDSDWDVYHFDKEFALVSSDNPVILIPPKHFDKFFGYGFGTPGTTKIISLSSNMCLVTKDMVKNPLIVHIDSSDKLIWKYFNKFISINSDRFIFSPDKGKLEKIVKDLSLNKTGI